MKNSPDCQHDSIRGKEPANTCIVEAEKMIIKLYIDLPSGEIRDLFCRFYQSHIYGEKMSSSDKRDSVNWVILFVCWLIAGASTLGSLFFSEVMEFAPCVLCWWQRIFIYPLVIIFAVGLASVDKNVIRYSLPLVVLGWGIALYHTLLYHGIISESIQACRQGVSCTEVYIELFGFLSIPMMSFLAFSAILVLLLFLKRRLSNE